MKLTCTNYHSVSYFPQNRSKKTFQKTLILAIWGGMNDYSITYLNRLSVFWNYFFILQQRPLQSRVVWNDFKNCTCEAKSMTYRRYIVFTILVHYTIYLAPFQSFTSKFFKHTVIVSWWGANVYALVTILLP